jgi:CRISPR-associated protein Csb3
MSDQFTDSGIRVAVDPTNPGQFFACGGLLELADRLWPMTVAWFEDGEFALATPDASASLEKLLVAITGADLQVENTKEPTTSPLVLGEPFNIRLDWWRDDRAGGSTFKTWAGQQKVVGIAKAMHRALERAVPLGSRLFDQAEILPDPDEPKKSVAPFYFDARRAAGALSLDIGFSTDAQKIDTLSFPAVEFLCLVGLQRFRAGSTADRTYRYCTWSRQTLLPPAIAAAAACGAVPLPGIQGYSFRLLFRTKYLKGFLPAIPIEVTYE